MFITNLMQTNRYPVLDSISPHTKLDWNKWIHFNSVTKFTVCMQMSAHNFMYVCKICHIFHCLYVNAIHFIHWNKQIIENFAVSNVSQTAVFLSQQPGPNWISESYRWNQCRLYKKWHILVSDSSHCVLNLISNVWNFVFHTLY